MRSLRAVVSRTFVAAAAAGLVASAASGAETGFESLSEGFHGEVLEVDGITFFNFGDWFDPPGTGQVAAIDDATLWLMDADPRMSDYVQGNLLNINGYSTPGYAFFRFQSMEMTTGRREVGASFAFVYVAADPTGMSWKENEAVLELYLDGELVASKGGFIDNVLGSSKAGTEYGASTITIEDVEFDSAKITTRGPVEEGTFLGGFDNFILGLDSVCRADLDGDGELTFFDFLVFQDLYAAGDLRADFTGDGVLDFFDFLAFQDEYSAGCP
jgi:hypothetical protein